MAHAIIQLNPALLPPRLHSHLPVLVPVVARDCPLSLILYPLLPPLTLYLAWALSGSILFGILFVRFLRRISTTSLTLQVSITIFALFPFLYFHPELQCRIICLVPFLPRNLATTCSAFPLSLSLSLLYQSPPLYQFLSRTFITVTRRVFIFLARVILFFSPNPHLNFSSFFRINCATILRAG